MPKQANDILSCLPVQVGRGSFRNRYPIIGTNGLFDTKAGKKGNKLTLAELRFNRIQEGRMLNPAWTMEWYEKTGELD